MSFMSKVAILGDETSVLGFKALGLDVFKASSPGRAKELWAEIKGQDYGVIFVTEPVYIGLRDLMKETEEQLTPAVIVIPPASGGTGLGMRRVKKIVEQAVGADILSKKEE